MDFNQKSLPDGGDVMSSNSEFFLELEARKDRGKGSSTIPELLRFNSLFVKV